MPRKFLGTIPPAEAQIRLRSNGQDWRKNGEESHSGNGFAHTNGHAQQHGAA